MNQNPIRDLNSLHTTTDFPRDRPAVNRSHAHEIAIVHSGCRWVEPRELTQTRIPTWHLAWCPQDGLEWITPEHRLVSASTQLIVLTPGSTVVSRNTAPVLMWYCSFLLGGALDRPKPRVFRQRLDEEGARMLGELARTLARRGPVSHSEIFLTVGLISWVMRQQDPGLWSNGIQDQAILRICETIDVAEGQWNSNRELAVACGLSVSHFISRFRAATGHTPQDYQRQARLARAAHLMLTGDPPIRYLAQRLGFTDRSHFSRSFASCYGQAPGRWRRMNKIVTQS